MSSILVEYKVIKAEKLLTKNNRPYYSLELLESMEKGGRRREAKIWEDVLVTIQYDLRPQIGQYWSDVVSKVNVFQRKEQLVILGYGLVDESRLNQYEKDRFVEPSVIDADRVIDRMFWWQFWDLDMQILMVGVVNELCKDGVFEKIGLIPAGASYHHSVKGGFLLHIDELLDFADGLCNLVYLRRNFDDPSKDEVTCDGLDHYEGVVDYQILRAAIVLHDIGKIYDYDENTLQYQPNPVSDCLEHTLVGVQLVDRHWPKKTTTPESIDRELRLKHAIAAHHGKEMGAVVPKTPEAILLHHLDMISASLDVCRQAYRNARTGDTPEYSKMLGARPFVPRFFPPEDRVVYRSQQSSVTIGADATAPSTAVVLLTDAVSNIPEENRKPYRKK